MDAIFDLGRFHAQKTVQIYPVILSGGPGDALWPVSRAARPKPFHALVSDRTLLQETVARNQSDSGFAAPIVVAHVDHRYMVEDQLRKLAALPGCVLLEPTVRDTGSAITVAALWLAARDPDAVMLVQPSDHIIAAPEAFRAALAIGLAAVEQGLLVAFGVPPRQSGGDHDYLQAGTRLNAGGEAYRLARFVAKPTPDQAAQFVASGALYWSSGILLARAGDVVEELERLHPGLLAACAASLETGTVDGECLSLGAGAYAEAPCLSFDRAVLDRTDRGAVVPVEMGWCDVSTWPALRGASAADDDGNVVVGDVLLEDVRDSYVRSEGQLVAMVGVEDITVVATPDAVLVAGAAAAGKVPQLVEQLRRGKRPETQHHTTTYRPWGYYCTIDAGERFQVKRIVVEPGAKLSLQKHFHRAEHWVVVCGTAMVEHGKDRLLLGENQSIYIPCGVEHRLENPGKLPLHLIEVQSGSYLGEDDIVRIADSYGRA
jgi:mannose-1-phosphate guanylyltransferase/mannose-6-phosphate isomerase